MSKWFYGSVYHTLLSSVLLYGLVTSNTIVTDIVNGWFIILVSGLFLILPVAIIATKYNSQYDIFDNKPYHYLVFGYLISLSNITMLYLAGYLIAPTALLLWLAGVSLAKLLDCSMQRKLS